MQYLLYLEKFFHINNVHLHMIALISWNVTLQLTYFILSLYILIYLLYTLIEENEFNIINSIRLYFIKNE